jgi:membrane fusion protein, multidrug efflux system
MNRLLPLLTAAALAVGCSKSGSSVKAAGPAASPGVLVKVAAAETRTMPLEIKTIGKVEAVTLITVRSQVGGTLLKAHFKEGNMVRQGDTLFTIDPRPFEIAIQQAEAAIERDKASILEAEAALARAQAQEEHARKQLERYKRLADDGIFSREQADQMAVEARTRNASVKLEAAAAERARAALRTNEAALASARLQLTYCTIHSPISGRTGSLRVQPGNLIKANDVGLVTIHQVSPTNVTFSVPEEKLLLLRDKMKGSGLPVSAAIPADQRPPSEGRVAFLDSSVEAATGTIRLKGNFANADARLWPGQFVNVRIVLEQRADAIVVPPSAMQTGQAGNFVYIVKDDNSVEQRLVKAGPRDDKGISLEGLQPGERVVVEGHLRIAPGIKVRVGS